MPEPTKQLPEFYRCGICDSWHPVGFHGDCREDGYRYTEEELEALYGKESEGWTEAWVDEA